MNQTRRKVLKRAFALIQQANEIVSDVLDDENDALSNWPESLEGTDRYQESESASEALDSARDYLNMAGDEVQNVIMRNL